jgi:hypothetical protein
MHIYFTEKDSLSYFSKRIIPKTLISLYSYNINVNPYIEKLVLYLIVYGMQYTYIVILQWCQTSVIKLTLFHVYTIQLVNLLITYHVKYKISRTNCEYISKIQSISTFVIMILCF